MYPNNDNWRPYEQGSRSGPMRRGRFPSDFLRYPESAPYHHPHPYAQTFETRPPSPPPSNHLYPFTDLVSIRHFDALNETGIALRNSRRHEQPWKTNCTDFKFFDAEISAHKIRLSWERIRNVRHFITCNDKNSCPRNWEQEWTQTEREIKTKPGQTYTRDEQDRMYKKAVSFVGRDEQNMHRFYDLSRCKPWSYWTNIEWTNGIMEKYMKDNNGQPANLINGAVNGLFFSAKLANEDELRPESPFGDHRMTIRAGKLLNPDEYSFYFADFYCNSSKGRPHYVTIVVCKNNSLSDLPCQFLRIKRLPQDNPFVKARKIVDPIDGHHYYHFFVTREVWVEIYHTEDVPLDWRHIEPIEAIGAGKSRIGGLHNNKKCRTCNLYPQKPGRDENGNLELTRSQDRLNSSSVTDVSLGISVDEMDESIRVNETGKNESLHRSPDTVNILPPKRSVSPK